jgi:hypothetical protein
VVTRRWLLVPLLIVAACGGDDGPPLSDATSLRCPAPGALPFRLQADGFASAANRSLAAASPRIKDQASDVVGNPGGPSATIYLGDDQAPAAGPIAYRGVKARTGVNDGLLATPLPGEPVSLWSYDAAATAWSQLGRTTTDGDGAYQLGETGFVAPPGQPVYAMLEADGTCAEHLDYLLAPGARVVVTDVDGTLTTDDAELIHELTDGGYAAAMKTAADHLMQAWAAKGYTIVYLTARPHLFRAETRAWLATRAFPVGPVITAIEVADAAAYKTRWLHRLIDGFGWNVVAAYGNADTDIAAYANAGIAKDHTFIIGPLAGSDGTVAIPNDDYSQHVATYVAAQPDNI